uniref:Uncharacterized protein n=1 Tax=Peronospora matthiolae TaxID=2874970 RepID=A0AAV1VCA7_9STRA
MMACNTLASFVMHFFMKRNCETATNLLEELKDEYSCLRASVGTYVEDDADVLNKVVMDADAP